jgi:hypothetical protein
VAREIGSFFGVVADVVGAACFSDRKADRIGDDDTARETYANGFLERVAGAGVAEGVRGAAAIRTGAGWAVCPLGIVIPTGLPKAASTITPAAHNAAANDVCQLLRTSKSSMT